MGKSWQIQRIILLVVLLIILPTYSFTQVVQKDYRFKSITTEDGLSNNVVFDIRQDKEGFIWFATNNGLNRYDGYSIKTFFHSKTDSTSISSNVVRSIIKDEQGHLWVGTKNGLNRYNKAKQNFERPIYLFDASFSNQEIQSMEHDSSGEIWISSSNNVGFFNSKTYSIQLVYSQEIGSHITLANEYVWISNIQGDIISYNTSTKKITFEAKSLNNNAIHFGKQSNKLWLPSDFQPKIDTSMVRVLPKLPNKGKPNHLLEIDDDKSWIGTDNGLFEYDYKTKTLSKIRLGKSTLTNQVRSLYKDHSGGVWVGTLGGVFHYDPYRKVFTHNNLIKDYDDIIMAINIGESGIYANALGRALYFKQKNSKQFKALELPKTFPEEDLFIWDLETVPEDNFPLWMATNDGIICLNPETLDFQKLEIPLTEKDENVSFSIFNTNQNFLWIASHRAIHKVRKKDRKLLDSFVLDSRIGYPGIQKIMAFGNDLFIATENNGLFKFNLYTKQFSNVYLNESKQALDIPIWDLFVSKNNLWIGTNNGLYRLSKESLHIKPVLEDNHVVFSITEDNSGVLWLGSDKGIKSYNPNNQKTKYYTTVDGLRNTEFNRKSVIKDASANLWFGGVNGITSFNPELVKKDNPNIPYVHITDLKVATSDSTFSIPKFKNNITLPWKHNTIEIEYIALNYTSPIQNRYRYTMEGHDPNWVKTDKPNTARYVKLPVGTYNFKVNAANSDGIWNTKGDSLEITITPPFWRTNTAYLFYIFSFIGLVWLFRRLKKYRSRIKEVEHEKEIIAKKVEEKFIVLNNKTKVYLKDLKYIKAAGNYLEFYTKDKTITDRNKLKTAAEKLPPNFIKTHRSFIVNKNYIISTNSTSVIIKPGIETPLSRSFKGSLS